MVRNKIISITMAALLSINSLWNPSPVFYDSIVADVKAEAQTGENEVVSDAEQVDAGDYGLCDNAKDGAILHAWCWSFNTIKENLKDIAEAGFTTVQTSPANTCYVGDGGGMELMGNGKWYYHYQPIDWQIGNYQLGTRDDFKAMCDEADKYGVKIIVDVNPNHTAGDRGAVKQGMIDAAGGMDKLYHKNWDIGCTNWTDRNQITNYKYSTDGCPDVCTENPGYQAYYVKYLNDLIECGVDGFRYDTAKHIGLPDDPVDEVTRNNGWTNNFWPVALGEQSANGVKLNGNTSTLFVYGEVLQDAGSRDADYAKLFNLTASNYGGKLRNAMKNKDFNVNTLSGWENAAGADRLVTWVESHDTYCNEHESGWMSDWDIRMCWAVVAARGSGTPLFYSRPDGSNASQGNYWGYNRIGAKGNDQFKDPQVAACNHFRNAMVGESEYLSNFGGNDCLVIERGTKGAVVINLGSQKSNIKLYRVADGTYTEEISGKEVQVSGGVLNYEVPAGSIAVVYKVEPVKKTPKVTASKASGTFQDAFTLTLTATNATKATYSVNGGDVVEFTGKATVKIGEGANVGDKITVKVTAEGEGENFSETFTYTMSEAPEYKIMLRVKKSDFDSAPTLYLYSGEGTSAKEYNGAWPGTAMTADGDYYIYSSDSVESATAILVSGTWRSTEDLQPGLAVSGYMEYDKASNKFTTFTMPVKTKAPAKETEVPVKETEAPTKKTEEPVKETEAPTEKPDITKVPATTIPAKETPEPTAKPSITVSKENGTSFSTETMDVKITLASGTKGTYSVDNGPEKSFTSSATVEVGKGKIADSEVTLKVTASGKTETYTYKKDFDPTKAIVKASAVSKIKSLFEIVSETAGVDAASNSGLASQYGTNTVGVGVKKTITVDDSISDWDSSMLIAQGAANDDPRVYRPNSMFEVPIDAYALYAAYDDNNLYLMWEMTNVQDVVAPSDDYPLSQGVMYQTMNIPFFIAIDTGSGDLIGNDCKTAAGGTLWDSGITITENVNRLIAISTNGANGPYVYSGDSSGLNTTEIYSKAGGGESNAEKSGIEFGYGMGILSSKVMGIDGAYGENNNRVIGDMCNESAAWVDFNTKGHTSAAMDYHYEMSIPYEELGISAGDVESYGLGVLLIATSGKSGMDCLPYDVSMNDQADLDDSAGSLENNSFEKSDEDEITTSFARVGNGTVTSGRPSAPKVTDEPKETEQPVEKTKAPTNTEEAKKTEAPTKTEEVKVTEKPVKTAEAADSTKAPTATPKATPKATEKPVSGPEYDGDFTVNFGADRSSPQYQTTELTLKAIPYGGSGDYTYEFKVDGTTIQKASNEDSCQWKGTEGSHEISVTVKDGDGAQVTCEKAYDVEVEEETVTKKPNPTETPVVTATPTVDDSGKQDTPSSNVTGKLSMSIGANKRSPQVAGTTIVLSIDAQGGTAPYKYTITVEGGGYGNTPNILLNKSSSNSCKWTPIKTGTYKVNFTVEDSKGDVVSQIGSFKISSSVSVSKFTANKYTVKKGKKVKFTMAATSKLSATKNIQYKISVLKTGKSTKTVIRKYSKAKSYSWKPKKKGKYTVYLTAKDTKGNTKTVKLSKKVTVK